MKKISCVFSFLLTSFTMDAQLKLDRRIHRIVFLGNSITYAGNYITDVEAFIVTHYPRRHFEFINVGLPSETVSGLSEEGHADGKFPRPDLHERLQRVLTITKPDLVFACYGMNDGIYLPFDETRFQKFKDGINWLHDEVIKTGAKIVHITPPIYDELNGKQTGYAAVLDKYADWIIGRQTAAKWAIADLHYPMKSLLDAGRKKDSTFAFASDGVHPNEAGHWIMAEAILTWLGETSVAKYTDIRQAVAANKNGLKILNLVAQRQSFMKDAWLTAAGHQRPGMTTGMPLAGAKKKAAVIQNEIRVLMK